MSLDDAVGAATETAAAPAGTTRPGPLTALALAVAIPATFILAVGVGDFRPQHWVNVGWLVFVVGGAVVVAIGRGTFGVTRTLVLTIATWAAFAFAAFVLFLAAFAQAFSDCGGGTQHPLTTTVVVAAGVVYVALGFWTLRKGWWWGLPIAVVLALVFCFVLAEVLPAVPKSTDDCSD
jgi:hypothetical protein